MQVPGEPLEVVHRPEPRVDGVVVDDRVATVVVTFAGCEQRHQVQVRDAQLGEVVEPVADAGQVAGEPVDVRHVADHPGPLEPAGVDLAAPVERAQSGRPHQRGFDGEPHQLADELGEVVDVEVGAVHPVERADQVEVVLLQSGDEALALHLAEPGDRPGPDVGEQRGEHRAGAVRGPRTGGRDGHHARS